jgi:adenosylcobinamide-GDP ribazoletransferase
VTAILSALCFLTIVGRGRAPDHRSLVWFGPVGLLVGGTCGLVRWGSGEWWAPAVAAALTIAADLVLTGALHLDGLADTADGVLPHLEREDRLAVMAAPDVGAFAIAVVGVTLLLRWSALATADVEGWRWIALLAGIWCAGRTAMVAILRSVPYARRSGGLAQAFVGGRAGGAIVIGVVLSTAAVGVGAGTGGLVGLVCGAVAAAGVAALARRRLGGFTGDVLGAAGSVLETVAMVVVAASW